MKIFSSEGITDILVHVGLIAAMIGLFYFLYVPIIEKRVVKNQVDEIMENLASDIRSVVPEDIINEAAPFVQKNLQTPDLREADKKATLNNEKVRRMAILYLGGLLVVIGAISGGLWWYYGFDIKDILKENVILLAFVAVTYFAFVTFIIANYRSADPNVVKRAFIESLINF